MDQNQQWELRRVTRQDVIELAREALDEESSPWTG
jgi:hypothetical protein